MSRLVIVANRVPDPKEGGATAGGLAVAMKDALANREAVWFGWSGKTAAETGTKAAISQHGRTTYATIDLGHDDYKHYYPASASRVSTGATSPATSAPTWPSPRPWRRCCSRMTRSGFTISTCS